MNILVLGYYGAGNLGDELVLSVLLKDARQSYPNANIQVISSQPEETERVHGVSAVGKFRFLKIFLAHKNADLLFFGGGGILQDKTSFFSLAYYLAHLSLAKIFHTPTFVYAIGVERIRSKMGRTWLAWAFRRQGMKITTRDLFSKENLELYGVHGNQVFVTADPVLTLKPEGKKNESPKSMTQTLLIPRWPMSPWQKEFFSQSARLAAEKGKVYGLLFQPGLEQKRIASLGDLPIEWLTNPDPTQPLTYWGPIHDADLVISARFHGLVLAVLARKRALAWGNPDKIGSFCRTRGIPFLKEGESLQDLPLLFRETMKKGPQDEDPTLGALIDAAKLTPKLLPL